MAETLEFQDVLQAFRDLGYDPKPYSGVGGCLGKRCLSVEESAYSVADTALAVLIEFTYGRRREARAARLNDGYNAILALADALKGGTFHRLEVGAVIYWPDLEWEDQ